MGKEKQKKASKKRITHEQIVYDFAKSLRAHRLAMGLKQKDLAKLAGVDPAFITRLERAVSAPGIDTVQKMAAALGLSARDLLPDTPSQSIDLVRRQVRERFESIMSQADQDTLILIAPWLALVDDALARKSGEKS